MFDNSFMCMRCRISQLAFCMLSACHSNVCCLKVACDSARLFFRLLVSGAHTLSLSFYIATVIRLCCYSLFVRSSTLFSSLCLCGVAVSYIPLMADEAGTTEAQEGGPSSTTHHSPSHRRSKNRRESRPSTTTPCIPCVRCAKRFAGAPGHICQRPNPHQNCTRCRQLGHACVAVRNILSVCFLGAANLLVAPKTVHSRSECPTAARNPTGPGANSCCCTGIKPEMLNPTFDSL